MSRRSGRKGVYSDPYASKKASEGYGTVFPSCLTDEKFINLPYPAKHLYSCCRAQSRSEEGRQCLYMYNQDNGTQYTHEVFFVFPASRLKEFGYDPSDAYRYMKRLIDSGFIRVAVRNKSRRQPNIYAFSLDWKK